jgi:hypothetical protein
MTDGDMEIQLPTFLVLVLDGGKWSDSHPGHFAFCYGLDKRLDGSQNQSHDTIPLVTTPTELSWPHVTCEKVWKTMFNKTNRRKRQN